MVELSNKFSILMVDIQNDFLPGGSLAVKDGDKIIGPLNKVTKLAREKGITITASRDWHPVETSHFDTWPVHCVQETKGAEFHPDLNMNDVVIFSKGMDPNKDEYSPFDGKD